MQNQIKCPNCQHLIDVQGALSQQMEKALRDEYRQKMQDYLDKQELKQQQELREKLAEQKKIAQEQLNKQRAEMQANIQQEMAQQLASMQQELQKKSEQIQEMHALRAQLARQQREAQEQQSRIEAEQSIKFNQQLENERKKIAELESEKNEFKLKELQKQLEDQKRLTEEMRRKQEQGSMQLQGEVLELAIEEYLRNNFPLDQVEEIKKGARGADCLQVVNTRQHLNCGVIYYESKRTKEFQPAWIEKFKDDIREKKADVGVLVTDVLPSNMQRMGQKDGIWICRFEEFKNLTFVLREHLIKMNEFRLSQENKGDKMSLLYTYLTSDGFSTHIQGIVESFSQMKKDLDREKLVFQKNWKQREKQIEKVISNTIDMYGSIKGIAGNAIKDVDMLDYNDSYLLEE